MLLIAWPALTLGIAAFLYAVALFAQRVFYEEVADRLPLRALVAGLLVGTLLTGWAAVNRRAAAPGKYGTLFDFSASSTRELQAFEAVRRFGAGDAAREEAVPFRRDGRFMVDPEGREFRRSSADYWTPALLVPEADDPEAKTRFAAPARDGTYVLSDRHAIYQEEGGRRTVSDENIGLMNVPNLGGAVGALALNALHFLAWFVAFWPILRFTLAPALVFTLVVGGASMFVLVPVLFQTFPRGVAA